MLLSLIFFSLLISLFILFFTDEKSLQFLQFFSLGSSGIVLVLSSFLLMQFDSNFYYFQNLVTYDIGFSLFNLSYSFGIDGVSIFFLFFWYCWSFLFFFFFK